MKIKVGLVAVLTLAMAAFGVGCTGNPPANQWEANNQAVSIGNFFLFLLIFPLCVNNGPNCPLPGDPVGVPHTTVAPPVDPPVIPVPEVPVTP